MNLNPATLPLPPLANRATSHPRRRHHIAGLELDNGALRRFQQVAESLQPDCPPPDADEIASAARNLAHAYRGLRRAPCIRLRLRCLAALRAMAGEPAWNLDGAKQQCIAAIAGYAANDERLVPDAVPVIGGLDEAILVDLAWPSLRFDLDDYLDFRRVRAEEAALRGLRPHGFDFDREQWLQSRFAMLAWQAHVRRCGRESYLGRPAPALFSIH